jgi:hypothetical protein
MIILTLMRKYLQIGSDMDLYNYDDNDNLMVTTIRKCLVAKYHLFNILSVKKARLCFSNSP